MKTYGLYDRQGNPVRVTIPGADEPTGKPAREWAAELQADPATSYWLKSALTSQLTRDPVDAVNDAELLLEILNRRLREVTS